MSFRCSSVGETELMVDAQISRSTFCSRASRRSRSTEARVRPFFLVVEGTADADSGTFQHKKSESTPSRRSRRARRMSWSPVPSHPRDSISQRFSTSSTSPCPRRLRCVSSSVEAGEEGADARRQDYVHQIGRTGRSGKTGIATTFVNMQTAEQTLLDLKYLLMEAKQKWILSPAPRAVAHQTRQDASLPRDDRGSQCRCRRNGRLHELWR